MIDPQDPRVVLARERTELAYSRNRWSAERTLMAWIRTSIAMVGFGFGIDRFVAYLADQNQPLQLDLAYHWYGLALVIVGVLLLIMAVAEHIVILRRLRRRELMVDHRLSLPLVAAGVIVLLGAVAIVIILVRFRAR